MPIDKPIDQITEADLEALIADGVREGKAIGFKRAVNISTPGARLNLLAAVASFANTQGGDMVFGMDEKEGIAQKICPLEDFDPDHSCLRLHDFLRAYVEPKLYGLHLRPVPLKAGGHALVLRIPRTWVGAHMVTLDDDNRFYLRHGNGRRLMDFGEVRMALTATEALPERLRRLRLDRLSAISAGEVPTPFVSPHILVAHLVPIQVLNTLYECDLDAVAAEEKAGKTNLMPVARGSGSLTYDSDGILRIDQGRDGCLGYTKLSRSGYLEATDCQTVSDAPYVGKTRPGSFATAVYESQIWERFPNWLQAIRLARLEPPALLSLSSIGMVGRFPNLEARRDDGRLRPIRHDPLFIAPTLIESFEVDAKSALLSQFHRVWQACGFPRSVNFD